jgi:hypothetical protein
LAEHFGLSQVADAARALEAVARDGPRMLREERTSYARRIEAAVAAVSWARFER